MLDILYILFRTGVFGEDFTVGLPNFVPGAYSLSVSATDVFEQSASVERSFTIIGKIVLTRICQNEECIGACTYACLKI